ncbi:MAG TPA: BamA/TamA family outer membrane protein, partial [Acidobacteriota bacterium]|nr:BamA/TamA family outer membrane protein [Acidobacteriota bacterium]
IMDLPQVVATIPKGSEPEGGESLAKSIETAALNATNGKSMSGLPALSSTDFEPAKEVAINKSDIQKKKFRGLLTGRPEVLTGVSGDTFAIATGVSVQDILGDQQVDFYISRIRGFQSYDVGYLDLGHRIQYRADFQFNDDFLIAPVPLAVAVQTGFTSEIVRQRVYGGQIISQYPLNRYYRFEMGTALLHLSEKYEDPDVQSLYEAFLHATGQPDFLSSGNYLPLNFSFVGETTRFREFGPIAGHTLRLSVQYAVPFGSSWISRTILDGDVRKYFRMTTTSLFALRARGFYSSGDDPVIFSFGGGGDVRGLDFREAAGNRGGIVNAEYRFPLFPNPRVPVLGQMRGRVFNDYIQAKFVSPTGRQLSYTTLNFIYRDVNHLLFAYDLNKGVASVGAGFTAFLGGTPFNFDFSKVYGPGRFALPSGLPDFSFPLKTRFQDGIHFDFSIIYDF